jgi:hypothetical protein
MLDKFRVHFPFELERLSNEGASDFPVPLHIKAALFPKHLATLATGPRNATCLVARHQVIADENMATKAPFQPVEKVHDYLDVSSNF